MALLLYTYSITSIRAAKRNAQLHREADGGQLDMRRESLRRHGVIDRVEGTGGLELFAASAPATGRTGAKPPLELRGEGDGLGRSGQGEKAAGQLRGKGRLLEEEAGSARTEVEGSLEGYKGRQLVRRMREREGG
jgi:hypothetical protein